MCISWQKINYGPGSFWKELQGWHRQVKRDTNHYLTRNHIYCHMVNMAFQVVLSNLFSIYLFVSCIWLFIYPIHICVLKLWSKSIDNVNYKMKKLQLWREIKLQLWDTGGMERVASITSRFYNWYKSRWRSDENGWEI